jgi:hypothetical protein
LTLRSGGGASDNSYVTRKLSGVFCAFSCALSVFLSTDAIGVWRFVIWKDEFIKKEHQHSKRK